MRVLRNSLVLSATVAAALVAGCPAFAGTASTPVGTLTATQASGPCNDLGADVVVSVASGFANTGYTATAPGAAVLPASFGTNGSGAGQGIVHNVLTPTGWSGTATITVTEAGATGQVTVAIACDPPKGG